MSSVNKVDRIATLYASGLSIPQVSDAIGLSRSTVRYHLKKVGELRSRSEGVRLAADSGRLGSGFRGKTREFSKSHRKAISRHRQKWGEENAKGVSIKPNGYAEYTRGQNKGRAVHVVIMEERLGRSLRGDECVHHIDGNKTNNDHDNLALVTRSGHTRLHRREQRLAQGMEA